MSSESRERPELPDPTAAKPPAIAETAVQEGVEKARLPLTGLIVLGLAAGVYVGLGGLFALVALAGGEGGSFGALQVLAGVVFSLGLVLVILGGAELFTGNMLFVLAWAQRLLGGGEVLKAWLIVYLANFAGSLLLAFFVLFSGVHVQGEGAVGRAALDLAESKAELSFLVAFFAGILGNLLVCLAVWLAFGAKGAADKILAITLPIAAFVAAGLEHSVANMFLIPYGLLIQAFAAASFWAEAGLAPGDYPGLTFLGFLKNLIAVTLGNMVGGVGLGMAYWRAYLAPAKS